MKALAALVGALIALASGPASGGLADTLFSPTLTRITRTAHGIVHVEAADEESLGFGIGYALGQDDGCAVADLLVTLRGERSRWFGAATSGSLGLRTLPNRVIDVFVRSELDDVQLEQAWKAASPAAHARALGVVEGFDRWLADTEEDMPPACADKGWVQPMTTEDLRRALELVSIQSGLGAWADAVVAAQPPRGGVPVRADWLPSPPVEGPYESWSSPRPLSGSGGFAFGRETSEGGRGLLLASPHLPWSGLDRLREVHLTIPGELDAMGATLGPLPWLAIGFNSAVAWAQTASPARRFTLHELQLVPGNPLAYVVDGQVEPMSARAVDVAERGPDTQLQSSSHVVYASRYGPIVVAPSLGLQWTTTTAYALQDAARRDGRQPDAWRGLELAASVADVRGALAGQGMAATATVAADRDGAVFFADASAVPDVPSGCAAAHDADARWVRVGLIVLDGARSACNWTANPDAARPGRVPPQFLPQATRADWLAADGSGQPFVNPAVPLAGYAAAVGSEGAPLRLSTRFALGAIRARLSADGGRARMGADELSALFFAHRSEAAELVLPDLLSACQAASTEASRTGCKVLAAWDGVDDAGSRGAALFREFWRQARTLPDLWRKPFDPASPLTTPSGLALADATRRQLLLDAVGQSVHAVRAAGVEADAPLGALQRLPGAGGPVAVGGGEESEGLLDALGTDGLTPLTRGGYEIDRGTSYLQLVGFDAQGPIARGLLVYGQSSSPGSPWNFDQLPDYAAQRWITLPFTPKEVAAQRVGAPIALRFRPALGGAVLP